MKVIFFFPGSASNDSYTYSYYKDHEKLFSIEDDIVRIYLRGCQHEKIGNGFVYPDLNIVAQHIKNAFDNDHHLNLGELKKNLGTGLFHIAYKKTAVLEFDEFEARWYSISRDTNPFRIAQETIKVDSLALEGFSRGAVTTFAVAKTLDCLNIPIDILANQPVPGDFSPSIFSTYRAHSDLCECINIRSAMTILGGYDKENSFLENHFFRQMIAKFPEGTHVENFVIPQRAHFTMNHIIEMAHLKRKLAELGYFPIEVSLEMAKQIKYAYYSPKELATLIENEKISIPSLTTVLNDALNRLPALQEKYANSKLEIDDIPIIEYLELFPDLSESCDWCFDNLLTMYLDLEQKSNIRNFIMKISTSPLSAYHKEELVKAIFRTIFFQPTEPKELLEYIEDWYRWKGYKYIFTPEEFQQPIWGADRGINKDPYYLEYVQEQANISQTVEEATAIKWLKELDLTKDQEILWQTLIKIDDPKSLKFCKIINKISEVCAYLEHKTKDASGKNKLIADHSKIYKKTIFDLSYQFLMQGLPDKNFLDSIYNAEALFRKDALSIERGYGRRILKFLTNFLTHITVLGLAINIANKMTTGNWLLFNHNESTKAIREARKGFIEKATEELPQSMPFPSMGG